MEDSNNTAEELELEELNLEEIDLEDTELELEDLELGDSDELELEDDTDELEDSDDTDEGDSEEGDTEAQVDSEGGDLEYGGEDGRPYSDFEIVGYNENIRGDEGVLRIFHNKLDEEGNSPVEDYQDRLLDYTQRIEAGGMFEDMDGEAISPRVEDGSHRLTMLTIDSLVFLGGEDERLRKGKLDLSPLETSIEEVGQIEPIIVVPMGQPVGYEKDENGTDILEMPIYARYQIVHGRRRLEAMANLGHEYIEAIIDTTLPRELLEFFQASATNTKQITFSEKMDYLARMNLSQPSMSPYLLESSVGFKTGELPKAEFIQRHKAEYAEVYLKVEAEKLTIEQGFKQINKEIDKIEKEREKAEQEALDGVEGDDVEDALRDQQNAGLADPVNSVNRQELGDRKILDTAVRRSVEARDGSECQICGYAHGMPERADNLKAHHMVAVQYGGSDSLDNLIMLCNNCHEEVHKYEKGRQVYYQDTFDKSDEVKRIVVLGNILRRARTAGIKYVRDHDSDIGKKMDAGGITVGQALKKLNVNLGIEESFIDNSPYKEFKQTTADLDYGGGLSGDLAKVWEFDDENEIVGEADENLEEPEVITPQVAPEEVDEDSVVGIVGDAKDPKDYDEEDEFGFDEVEPNEDELLELEENLGEDEMNMSIEDIISKEGY